MINPILQNRQYLIAYAAFWFFITLLLSVLRYWSLNQVWEEAIIESFIYVASFGFIGLSIWFVVRFTDLETSNIINAIITHLAAASLLLFIWHSLAFGAHGLLKASNWNILDAPTSSLWWWTTFGYFFYVIIALNYYLLIFYQNYQEKQIRESEMKIMLKESELSMLKAQINPHFIFNSLNSISTLTLTAPENAHEMIVKLSTFLRYTIGQSETDLVPLNKEIEAMQLYLEIEKSRFGDKLQVNIEGLDHIPVETNIPNLILQPLVENAIKYGVYESTQATKINMAFSLSAQMLAIHITNKVETDSVPKKGKGIGLNNVKSRLQLNYGRFDLLQTKLDHDTFHVRLSIPQIITND
jgi:sensor histidine kinase YesM